LGLVRAAFHHAVALAAAELHYLALVNLGVGDGCVFKGAPAPVLTAPALVLKTECVTPARHRCMVEVGNFCNTKTQS
jgi:hypothetical protein